MNASYLLSGIAIFLGAVIGCEWVLPTADMTNGEPALGAITNAERTRSPIAAMGANALAARILDRPLFLVGRHIIPPPPPPPPVVASQKADPPPRLTGIFLAEGEKIAIFQVAGQLRPFSAEVGGRVSDWKVTAIDADKVTIAGAAGAQTLRPSPDPSDAAGTADSNASYEGDVPAAGQD